MFSRSKKPPASLASRICEVAVCFFFMLPCHDRLPLACHVWLWRKKPPCRHSHVKKPKLRGRLRRDIPPSEPPCFIERPELYDASVSRPLSWRQSCPLRRPAAHVAGSFGIRICAPGAAVPAGTFGPLEKFRPGHNHQSRAYQGSERACFLWVRLQRTHASMQALARGQVLEK